LTGASFAETVLKASASCRTPNLDGGIQVYEHFDEGMAILSSAGHPWPSEGIGHRERILEWCSHERGRIIIDVWSSPSEAEIA